MNRIVTVGLFTSLKRLVELNDMTGISEIAEAVLNEAQHAKKSGKITEKTTGHTDKKDTV